MTSTLLDRIERDLADALVRDQRRVRARRWRRRGIRAATLVAALTASAGVSAAAGLDPFDELFSNDPVSRPAPDPGTVKVTAPSATPARWSVIAYRRSDHAIGVSAVLDGEGGMPAVSWMGTRGLELLFQNNGPLLAYTRTSRIPGDESRLVYGLVHRDVTDISVTVGDRMPRVYRSSAGTLGVEVFAAPVDAPGDTAQVTVRRADGMTSMHTIDLGPSG